MADYDGEIDYSDAEDSDLAATQDELNHSSSVSSAGSSFAIAGAGIGAAGSIEQGYMNASVADYNAQIAEQNARVVQQQAAAEIARSRIQSQKAIGSEKAAYGASGVSGGSAIDVIRASAAQGQLNALLIQNKADVQSTAYANEAALDNYRAGNMKMAGFMGAAGDLMKGGASAAMMG